MGGSNPSAKEEEMATSIESKAARVPWSQVAGFAVLAYAISWTVWASVMPDAWDALKAGKTPSAYTVGGLGLLGMFGPAVAALIMRVVVTREGVRGSLGARRDWRRYAIALVAPMILVTAAIAVSHLTGLADFHAGSKPIWLLYLVLLAVDTPISTVATLGEEYGWRGYLLPRLLPLGEVKAALVVAAIWAPWHLPLLLVGLNYGGKNPFAVLGFMLALAAALSLLLTRLFVIAGGSVLVTAVAHASFNAFGDRLSDADHLVTNPFLGGVGGVVGLAVMAIAALAIYGHHRVRRPHAHPAGAGAAGGADVVTARTPA
jgi:membrane protease YdiL (CAAX protease family)